MPVAYRDFGYSSSWARDDTAGRDASFSAVRHSEVKHWIQTRGVYWKEDLSLLESTGPRLNQLSGPDFLGTEFSIRNGERTTVHQPISGYNDVLCFGGSTTFCVEVADDGTWPSVLQLCIARDLSPVSICVRNLGIGGTPGLERILTYKYKFSPKSGDVAVFLFGDNDSGWKMYGSREGMCHQHLPSVIRLLLRAAAVFELSGWLYGELSPRYLRRLAVEMAEATIAEADEVAAVAKSKGAKVLFVLQPNIFTMARPDEWDRKIIDGTARDLGIMLSAAYGRYRRWIVESSFVVSATHIFDHESPSPYMGDWAHANTRGNQLIGEFVYKQLKSRGWLSETTSV